MSASREKILGRLKSARDRRGAEEPEKPDMEAPIYTETTADLVACFQEKLELVSGMFHRLSNLNEAASLIGTMAEEEKQERVFCLDPVLQQALAGADVGYKSAPDDFDMLQWGVTPCEFLIAHLGSVMVSSGAPTGRRLHVFPETHLVVAHQGQLVRYLDEALSGMQKKYAGRLPSMVTNITGPSRTADIEKTLVKGMHGPRKLIVLLCDEPF